MSVSRIPGIGVDASRGGGVGTTGDGLVGGQGDGDRLRWRMLPIGRRFRVGMPTTGATDCCRWKMRVTP